MVSEAKLAREKAIAEWMKVREEKWRKYHPPAKLVREKANAEWMKVREEKWRKINGIPVNLSKTKRGIFTPFGAVFVG